MEASTAMPKPTSPFPFTSPSGSGLKLNAAAAAGQDMPLASSVTDWPRRAFISAGQ